MNSHKNAPLTPEGRTRFIERSRTRPIAHVPAQDEPSFEPILQRELMTGTTNVFGMVISRPAVADDYARLVDWVPDTAALYLFAGPSLVWPPTAGQFEELSKRPGLSAWMVADNEHQAAWGHFDLTVQGRSARLGRVIIDPRYRGQGLGHALTRAAIEKARGLEVSEVRLAVVTDNEPAVKAYRRAGFKEVVDPERPQFTAMAYPICDCP